MFFNFIRGQLLECVILGSLCYVGHEYFAAGLCPAHLFRGDFGGTDPYLGAYIGAAVGVLILLLVHPIDALIS